MGVSIGLKEKNPKVKIYIVEPANSAVIPAKPVPAEPVPAKPVPAKAGSR